MKRLAVFLLAVILALAAVQCGIYAEANVVSGGPVYVVEISGEVLAWGYVWNAGTATAEDCWMTLEVFSGDKLVESHNAHLGDIRPDERVKFEIILESVKFGDEVECRTEFHWD